MADERQLLIDAWHARNELFKELFGPYASVSPVNYCPPRPLAPQLSVEKAGGAGDPGDEEDQRLAVLAHSPDPLRPYWTYITAGLSSPWYQDEPQEVSGFGCEILIKTPDKANWPARILRSMAFYVFNYAGTLSPGVRIGLNAPISVDIDSDLRNVFIWYADEAPDCWYQLPSGGFGIFAAVGITEDELKYAESVDEYGTWCIQEVLRQAGVGQITDPGRKSVMSMENVKQVLPSLRMYAENFPRRILRG